MTPPNASSQPSAGPVLSIRGLRFRYPHSQTDTVSVASLDLAPGEQVLLTAGSGRGKSTLLQLIAGLLDAGEGTISLAGADMVKLRGASRDTHRGRHLGMIFQTFNLLQGFTALENVLAALMFSELAPREHRERAMSLLTRLGIERPDAPAEELSVGQQQRVAVARAVAARPALVLADEPTASLDPENAAGAMDLIQSACRDAGAALLCVSHDPSMAPRFARRLALAELSMNSPAIGAAR
jgi:ABC-type lipoprotein export system ATPase subunit